VSTPPEGGPRRGGLANAIRNFATLLSADLVAKLTGVALVGFYARSLAGESLAFLPLYEMIGTLVVLLSGFGMVPTVVRRLAGLRKRDPERAAALAVTAWRIPVAVTAVASAVVAFQASRLGPLLPSVDDAERLVRIMCLGFPTIAARRVSDAVLWSAGRFPQLARVEYTRTAGSVAALGIYLMAGIEGLIAGLVLRDWVTAGLSRFLARELLRRRGEQTYPPLRLIREARAFHVEAFVLYLRGHGDRWIVASYLGPGALATYFVAYRLAGFILGAFHAADRVITTGVVGRRHDVAEVEQHVRRLLVLFSQTLIPGICLVAGLAPTLVGLMGGEAHEAAELPALLLCLGVLTHFLLQPLSRAIFAVQSARERLRLSVVESILLIGSLAALTPLAGMIGAAMARVVAGAGAAVYAWWRVRRFAGSAFPVREVGVSMAAGLGALGLVYAAQQVQPALWAVPFEALLGLLAFLAVDAVFNRAALDRVMREIRPAVRTSEPQG